MSREKREKRKGEREEEDRVKCQTTAAAREMRSHDRELFASRA
jgi:hypothetical protein